MSTTNTVNIDEAERWNATLGETWVQHQEFLDASMAGILDLLMNTAKPQPGEHVLDIGCGCGATSFEAARHVGKAGQVLGADISVPMLDHATKRAQEMCLTNVVFKACDAQIDTFAPHSFDLVLSRFGVMFFSDPEAAFRNIAKAVKPGGRVVLIAWAELDKNPWFSLPRKVGSRRFDIPPPGDQNAPGPMAFHNRDRVEGLLRGAGLQDVASTEVPHDLTPPGGADQFANFMGHFGSLASTIRDLGGSEDDVKAYVADLKAEISQYETAGRIHLPSALNVFEARA